MHKSNYKGQLEDQRKACISIKIYTKKIDN